MDKLISITEFTAKVCTFLEESYKNGSNLIITKHGKPYMRVMRADAGSGVERKVLR